MNTEAELVQCRDALLQKAGLSLVASEVRIGAYRLDAIAADNDGALVVVEFKTNASMATLGQLLLYPHALRKALAEAGTEPPRIRALLITTCLDVNVERVVQALGDQVDIELRVCVDDTPEPALVAPGSAGGQVWDQSAVGPRRLEPVLAHLRGRAFAGTHGPPRPGPEHRTDGDAEIVVSLDRVRSIIADLDPAQFTTADVIRGYCGGFFANTGTPAYYSFNAQFGKLLKSNMDVLGIRQGDANVATKDDRGHPTSTSCWSRAF